MTSNQPAPVNAAPEPNESNSSGFQQLAIVALVALGFALFRPALFQTIATFILILGILVFVHEWGHFQFARWAGLKVNRFALGFPPFIFTRIHNGINYSIGALPIGGMVDIAGLGSEEEMVAEAKGQSVAAPLRNPHRPRGEKQFQDVSLGWRFLTLFAGPLMNFVFAIVVSIGLFSLVGAPNFDNAKMNVVALIEGGSPAEKAGLQTGDLVVGVNGQKVDQADAIRPLIRNSTTPQITLQVRRGTELKTFAVTPKVQDVVVDENGNTTERARAIGVVFDFDPATVTYRRVGVSLAATFAFRQAFAMISEIGALLKRAVTFKLTSVDKSSVGGPVKIAQTVGHASQSGGAYQLTMLAIALSVNLGLLNLLPFPALDGGRILFLGYELIMRRPIDPRKENLIHLAGMAMLLTFMLFITLRDVNFFKLLGH